MGKDSFSDTSYEAQTNSMDLQNGEILKILKLLLVDCTKKTFFIS